MGQFFWRIIARMGFWVRFKLFEMKEFRRFELHKFTAGILKIQASPPDSRDVCEVKNQSGIVRAWHCPSIFGMILTLADILCACHRIFPAFFSCKYYCIEKPCCEASFNAKFPTARALEESQRAPWIHENDWNGASAKQAEKVKDCTWDLWLTGTTATGTRGGLQSHQRAQGRASSWELHGSQMADWADCLKSFKNSCEDGCL